MGYNDKIKVGSVVVLKSGSIVMTVESEWYEKRHNVLCVWFKENDDIAKYIFDADMLEVRKEIEEKQQVIE